MISPLLLGAVLLGAPLRCAAPDDSAGALPASDSIQALYQGGRTWTDFLDAARSRRDQWLDHWGVAEVTDAQLARGRALPGAWKVLAVAEDWCGDSANTIPYLARLFEALDGVDLRIVNSTVGKGLMQAHPTPDGRASTPTVLILDEAWNVVGCFVERPAPLMAWYQAHRDSMDSKELHDYMYAWYDEDLGASTVDQVLGLLEAAASGHPRCQVAAPSAGGL